MILVCKLVGFDRSVSPPDRISQWGRYPLLAWGTRLIAAVFQLAILFSVLISTYAEAQDARACVAENGPYISNKCKTEILVFTCVKGNCQGDEYYTYFVAIPPGGEVFEESSLDNLDYGACFGSYGASINGRTKDYSCVDLPEGRFADTSIPGKAPRSALPGQRMESEAKTAGQSGEDTSPTSRVAKALQGRRQDCDGDIASCQEEQRSSENVIPEKTLVCPGLRHRVVLSRVLISNPHLIRMKGTTGITANINLMELARDKDEAAEALLNYERIQQDPDTSDLLEGTLEFENKKDEKLQKLQDDYLEAEANYNQAINNEIRSVCGLDKRENDEVLLRLGETLIEYAKDCRFDVSRDDTRHCLYEAPNIFKGRNPTGGGVR
jgi:hypothetical protein